MVAVNIYICPMRYVHEFYTILSLSLFFLGKFVIYTSCEGVILTLHLHYIFFFIDMFVHNITVSLLTFLCMLYNIIIGCTSSWEFSSILLLCMVYSTTVLFLYLRLYSYVCEYYIYVSCYMFV